MQLPKLVIVLEDASLLSTDKESRVDILHQSLLVLLDSPLNKNGFLKVLIRTDDGNLVEVSPHLRVPRTPKQFESLLVYLLYKRHVKSQERDAILMRFIKNEIEIALPPGSRRFGLSVGGRQVKLKDFCHQFKAVDYPVVFHIGAVSHTHPKGTVEHVEEVLSISDHGLTAAHVCAKVCSEFEYLLGVL
ncbi:EMG1/NEP1 methyltransferase family protein [Babesia bovis T2Bo]|uniref:Suppressor Mra1 family domain containing protein n=1 Tax=Babesia bovis TaxID=5865 RepID=A7AWE3_BABBO|nr:EMG1/NEP1 methyltransferase family protein [Babesia bovis T2Bo]EDO05371.1 EMG1/NEP1 methyltransferase family protein [Babesia bovis T2Bo]|eukprot:XP_001608939.1 suppressor Mra1 family domain containing protein [Babesia bovis T2Bo]